MYLRYWKSIVCMHNNYVIVVAQCQGIIGSEQTESVV